MKYPGILPILAAQLLVAGPVNAEIVNQPPLNLSCTVSGTGAGLCNIVFSAGTISSCTNTAEIVFDPASGTVGKEVYGMVLMALAEGKALQISTAGCHANGRALIDWIKL